MSIPDFDRAEYTQPRVIDGEVLHVGRPMARGGAAFPLALLYGTIAAVLGCAGYALIWSFGFMISIVSIGIAWMIVKAMMTASGGVGGRPYQWAAVLLTYFAVSCGEIVSLLWRVRRQLPTLGVHRLQFAEIFAKRALLGPFLDLSDGINGVLGLVILGIGLRSAWRLAAGSPGFGLSGRTRRVDPFGLR